MRTGYRGLVCTHHLHEWAGSECVTLEVVEEFQRQGCEVSLYCPHINTDMVSMVLNGDVTIISSADDVDISLFDFVYSHHQMPSRFLIHQPLATALGARRPIFIYNHLSPFEPFEFPGPWCEAALADIVLCNSPETAGRIAEFGCEFDGAILFPNPAPRQFEADPRDIPADQALRLLSVSNHLPHELLEAFELLTAQGIAVERVGKPESNRRVTPHDITNADAVVTIGKSVPYALRARRPVFCYDWFGGPGWIQSSTYTDAAATNFSGRSAPQKRSAQQLADELVSGFAKARQFATRLPDSKLSKYKLEKSVKKLLKQVRRIRRSRRRSVDPTLIDKLVHEAELYKLLDREYESRLAGEPIQVKRAPSPNNLQAQQSGSSSGRHDNIETRFIRTPASGKSKVIAVFAYRYDVHLVPGLLENIEPFVHGWVAWDDRCTEAEFTGDAQRRQALFNAAREMGADWILAADPDERYELALSDKIDSLTNDYGPVCWTFDCRELFEPMRYRVDGLWHDRPRVRLFPCLHGMQPDGAMLHSQWTRNDIKIPTKSSELCFYHLRMCTRERRCHRRDVYAAADPERRYQNIGYDYIADDRGMELEHIQPDRMYAPLEKEDHGLWAPDIEYIGAPESDPFNVQLNRLETTLYKGGGANASYLAEDIYLKSDNDIDLGLMAAELCLRVGRTFAARRISEMLSRDYPNLILPSVLHSRILNDSGNQREARRAIRNVEIKGGYQSLLLQQQLQRTAGINERLFSDHCLWRRWVNNAELFNGAQVCHSEMAVVVISYLAPLEVADAVSSLRCQDEPPEIIVVNSGGGDIVNTLSEHMEHIRLVDVEERLFAGSARNIGIDVSNSPYIAFLASDCTATPGWVRNRLSRHRAGAAAVASAVIPEEPDNFASIAAHYLMHWRRRPVPEAGLESRYGVSCSRRAFESFGYFPTGLRLGEDTSFNAVLRRTVGVAWAPDVISAHRYPTSEQTLLEDMRVRGRRRAQYAPFSNPATVDDLDRFTSEWSESSVNNAVSALETANVLDSDDLKTVVLLIKKASEADVTGVKEGWQDVQRARQLLAVSKVPDGDSLKDAYTEALDLWSQSVRPRLKLAQLLTEEKEEAPADYTLELLRESIALTPTSAESVAAACRFLEQSGDAVEALRLAEQACVMSPTELPFWWELNGVASRTGSTEIQILALQNIVTINPANKAAQEILARLYQKSGEKTLAGLRRQMAESLA